VEVSPGFIITEDSALAPADSDLEYGGLDTAFDGAARRAAHAFSNELAPRNTRNDTEVPIRLPVNDANRRK
jgi:hypothetical protein